MNRAEKEARVKELDKQIREYPYWGAFLTAADEERRGLKRSLAAGLPAATVIGDNPCVNCTHDVLSHRASWHPGWTRWTHTCGGDALECLCTEFVAARCDPRDCDDACPGPVVESRRSRLWRWITG